MNAFKLLFLGTSARNYSPKLNNECKDKFDKTARRSACALLNDNILIDCGFHTLNAMDIAGVKKSDIKTLFITHFHDDHFNLESVQSIANSKTQPLDIFVSDGAVVPTIENAVIHYLKKGEKMQFQNGITITSLLANHDKEVFPQHLLFEKDGEKFLYACDGAWFLTETFYALKDSNLALFVVDCTVGDRVGDYRICEHNSIPMLRLMLPSLKTFNIIDDKTKIFASHIA